MTDPFGTVERPRACKHCHVVKAADQFCMLCKDGYMFRQGHCRTCETARRKQCRERNRDAHLARVRDYQRELYHTDPAFRARKLAKVRAYKRRLRLAARLDQAA